MTFSVEPFDLIPGFLAAQEGERLFDRLLANAAWQDEYLQMFGRRLRSPRQVCWYGDVGVGYRYSGSDHQASGWLQPLEELRERLQEAACARFNFALLNRYDSNHDSMGWHADNEPELGHEPVIASVSLGESRNLLVRPTKKIPGERRQSSRLRLDHGSLLLMRGVSQSHYEHALPKTSQSCGVRINLTFRYVFSDAERLVGRL